MRLWTSNKHLSKINLVTRPLPFLRNIINDMSKISIIVILFEIVFSIYYRKFSVTKIFSVKAWDDQWDRWDQWGRWNRWDIVAKNHNFRIGSHFLRSGTFKRCLYVDFDTKIRNATWITCILGTGETWYFKIYAPHWSHWSHRSSPAFTHQYACIVLMQSTTKFVAELTKIV